MKRRYKILIGILSVIAFGFLLPESRVVPVELETRKDWNKDSFLYEPWGSSGVHKGVDIFAGTGTDVLATMNMLILYKGTIKKGGNIVVGLGPKWRIHYFAHLEAIDPDVTVASVGQVIGTVGDTGNAKGKQPHLHYSIVSLIPLPWLVDSSTQGYKKAFYLDPIEYFSKARTMTASHSSRSPAVSRPSKSGEEGAFVHPGALNNRSDLEHVKAMINAGAEPWLSAFYQLRSRATSSGTSEAPLDEGAQHGDAHSAYANALVWYYTENTVYAENAIHILNVWGNTFNGYGTPGGQNLLQGAWVGSLLGAAAEIMRDYDGWSAADIVKVQTMFRNTFYPVLKQMSTWNGNVDLTQIEALLSIAVFNEDKAAFDLALQRLERRMPAYFYLDSDPETARNYGGSTKNSWFNVEWVNGVTQETCRDNNHHAQFAMGAASHALEVAYNQGRQDVVKAHAERMIAVLELMAMQQLTGSMQGVCADNKTTNDLYNTWQTGYNLYSTRMGYKLPKTSELITTQVRASGDNVLNLFFETLIHNTE